MSATHYNIPTCLRSLSATGLITLVVLIPGAAHLSGAQPLQCAWNVIASPTPNGSRAAFRSVSELNATNVWAVATTKTGNLVEHWNGTRWRVVPGPTTGGALYAVKVIAKNDVWFTGQVKTSPLIERWTGSNLAVVPNPAKFGSLQSIYAVSPTNIWAVGYVDDTSPALIERWNGSAWKVAKYPHEDMFRSISGTSRTDIWAAGNGFGGEDVPFSEMTHWNGSKWLEVDNSIFGEAGSELSAVFALSSRNVWTVGHNADGSALLARYDGKMWRPVVAPATTANLVALAGSNSKSVLAAGGTLNQHALAERWNGLRWSKVSTPEPPRSPSFFTGLTLGPKGDGWAVGFDGAGSGTHTLAEHFTACT